MSQMVEFKLTRKNKPPLLIYFKTVEDVKMFTDFIEELIENVITKTLRTQQEGNHE